MRALHRRRDGRRRCGAVTALGRLAAAGLAAVTLAACVDVEMRFVMRRGGAGVLELDYRVPAEAATLLDPVDGAPSVPLPITRADFDAAIAGAKGARLRRYRRTDDGGAVAVSVRISFDSVEALRTVAGFGGLPVSFTAGGDGGGELSQRVIPARAAVDAPDPRLAALAQALAGESRVTFVVAAPAAITDAGGAAVDADGRTARLSFSLADYLTDPGPVDLIVRWRG